MFFFLLAKEICKRTTILKNRYICGCPWESEHGHKTNKEELVNIEWLCRKAYYGNLQKENRNNDQTIYHLSNSEDVTYLPLQLQMHFLNARPLGNGSKCLLLSLCAHIFISSVHRYQSCESQMSMQISFLLRIDFHLLNCCL